MALEEPEDIDQLREFLEKVPEENIEVPPIDTTFPECILVDCIPKVDEAKKPKLLNVLKKIFSQVGEIVNLEMPMDGAMSLGFAFIEFHAAQAAKLAVERVNGYKLDKNHVFRVIPYSDISRLKTLPKTYVEPPEEEFKEPPYLEQWLRDEAGRDQFVIRHSAAGKELTSVAWGELGRTPQMHYGGEREMAEGKTWCELEVMWSPKGSYLATFHRRGIAIWGGDSMEKIGRFAHDNVNRLSFSPCERFMLTCNFRDPREGDSTVVFWEVATQRVLRKLPLTFTRVGGTNNEEIRYVPNLFRWAHDGAFVAQVASSTPNDPSVPNDLIKIYTLPSMQLLDSKSLRTKGVVEFSWSPTDHTVAYWAAEEGNTPARVCLVAIPSRAEVRQKNLFSVTECSMTWQPTGDYLSVKVVRHTKSKKTHFNNLELFRIREDLVPVETVDVKAPITGIQWEPKGGSRFGLITQGTGEAASTGKPCVTFYDMMAPGPDGKAAKSELTLLKALPNRQVSHLFWSPAGQHCVLAALPLEGQNDYNGSFEFYDVDSLAERGREVEHYRANRCEWDPSGRIFMTAVTQPLEGMVYKFQMDNGYHLWTFQGESFFEKQWEKFYSFAWRPRPPSLLSTEEQKKVVKNLRKFERKFERADREQRKARELSKLLDYQRMRTEWRERLAARKARNYDGIRAEKAAGRYGYDEDDDTNYVVDTIIREVVVSSKEEVVQIM